MSSQQEPKRPDIFHDVNDAITPRGLAFKSEAERLAAHGEARAGGFSVVVKTAPENEFQKPPAPAVHDFASLDDATRAFSRMELGERDRVSLQVGAREVAHKLPLIEQESGQDAVTGERWQWSSMDGKQQRETVRYPDPIPERPGAVEEREARHVQIVTARQERSDNADKVLDAAREVLGDAAAIPDHERKKAEALDRMREQQAARSAQRERGRGAHPDRYRDL